MKDIDIQNFRTPGAAFRGAPLWAWNSKLEIPELRRQIRILKKMGFGGFFMHSRVGLDTEYLGHEWFECVRACVEEAEKKGLKAWLYDEDRWPSGFAGSKVTEDDRFKMKSIFCEEITDPANSACSGNTLAYFLVEADFEQRIIFRYRKVDREALQSVAAGEKILRFYWQYDKRCSWFNGETYIDTLNEDAVQKFVEVTHEQYRKHIGEYFGSVVPGIFSDEPCYSHFNVTGLPWSFKVPEEFQKEYGCSLLEHLPELFFHYGEEVNFIRWAYFNLITAMFVRAFSGTIGKWCGKNNMKMTGHVLTEDSLTAQTACSGAVMRFYEYMQMPGIDLLTEHWDIWVTVKQCVSAARQFGKPVRLTEIYGCTGWDFPFFGHKALGDWQYALGINFRCPHLAWYSMRGESKRDYPASISYQSPWAEKYPVIEDYFARIGSILTGGAEIRELLVIHPIESFWSSNLRCYPELIPPNRPEMDLKFEKLTKELLAENLDFDYGDEDIIARYGSCQKDVLHVGKAVYRAVLIPELKTIRSTTLQLLKDFAAAGGMVGFSGKAPEFVDARKSDEAAAVFEQFFTAVDENSFITVLAPVSRRVSLTDDEGKEIRPLLFHFAEKEDFHSLFICNFGKEFSGDMMMEEHIRNRTCSFDTVHVKIKMANRGKIYELDPETGSIHAVEAAYLDGGYSFTTSFAQLGSRLFVISENMPQEILPPREEPLLQKFAVLPDKNWQYTLDEQNCLVLDHADYLVDGKLREHNKFILHIDDTLRKELGSELRGVMMAQPWKLRKTAPKEIKTLDLTLRYHFVCESLPDQCQLVLENPELYTVFLNGKEVFLNDSGYWVDTALRTLTLPENCFITGNNTLELKCRYSAALSGLENIYLLGSFGVKNESITRLPSALDAGSWVMQGLPYYAGNVTYRLPLATVPANGRVFIKFPSWRGCLLGIRVNGGEEKFLAWQPERVEITSGIKRDGQDEVQVTVYSHRRNAFGPFYLKDRWPVWTGNIQFKTCEVKEKQSVPTGLLSAPVLETGI